MTEAIHQGLNLISSENSCVEVKLTSESEYLELPGVQSHVEGGGDLTQTQVRAFKGVASRTSKPEVPSITISGIYNPQHPAWRKINDAARQSSLLDFQITTFEVQEYTAPDGVTLSIDGDGVVSYKGGGPDFTSDRFAPGMAIQADGGSPGMLSFVIVTIDVDGKVVVEHDGSNPLGYDTGGNLVAAGTNPADEANSKIVTPKLRLNYAARAGKPPASIENEANIQTSFTVYPTSLLDDWKVLMGS